MVRSERQQDLVHQYDVLEVIDHTLPIQEVHCGPEEIPVQRLCESQTPRPAGHVGYGDDLLEGHDLDGRDNHDDVDVAREH